MSFPRINGLRGIEFGTPGEFREKLNALVLAGQKKATSGILEVDYLAENEEIETVGEHLAVLDSDRKHIATIRATKVEVRKFSEVPDEFALAEGEGDTSGTEYRESHLRYWSKLGLTITDETHVVLLYFDLVSKVDI